MSRLLYLASPYSHPDPSVKDQRFREACRVAGNMMKRGDVVFAPIPHSHSIEQCFSDGKAEGGEFWLRQDFAVLRHCAELVVLMLPGWDASKGVAAEIDFANTINLPIRYIDP